MDALSSGEDLTVKTRKPYTITKQRERWTEEEHNRFLEALKLYGRAWQRIEEHIGTKTAVQIRSHAQKFFTKLEKEKEALTKGIPLVQAHDIDIPPPRPKRKPSNPYPRKTGIPISSVGLKDGKPVTSVGSTYPSKQRLDLENDPPQEEPLGSEAFRRAKQTPDEGNCSEVLNPLQENHYSSISSTSKTSSPRQVALTNPCGFREFVPSTKKDQKAIDEQPIEVDLKMNQDVGKSDNVYKDLDISMHDLSLQSCSHNSNGGRSPREGTNDNKQLENLNELPCNQNYPRHIPVHVVDGKTVKCMQNGSSNMDDHVPISQQSGDHANPSHVKTPSATPTSEHHTNTAGASNHQIFPCFYPSFSSFHHNQDAYRSYMNFPSTFSSLLISTLLQNPAAHAMASLAASTWPCAENSMGDNNVGPCPVKSSGTSPSLVAVATATVAAASSWWASQGLLPFCPPLHTGFIYAPAPTMTTMTTTAEDTFLVPKDAEEKVNSKSPPQESQVLDPELSVALKSSHSLRKSAQKFSSDSEESGDAKSHVDEQKAEGHAQMPESSIGFHVSKNGKTRKQLDRSSCGSNTPSGSEVEGDMVQEKHNEGKEDLKDAGLSHSSGEPINRRTRSTGNLNDSWKEVSEEGRLAFQALFSRDVLPQSFSPPHELNNKVHPINGVEEKNTNSTKNNKCDELDLELSSKASTINLDNPVYKDKDELIAYGKVKARRTGFKPYKRCSAEAKESRVSSSSTHYEEKDAKRIRLEGEASA